MVVGNIGRLSSVFLQGGADSWNFWCLTRMSVDGGGGYKHYSNYRGIAALNKSLDELLPIDVEGQACSRYGLHHKMPFLQKMYEEKQLSSSRTSAISWNRRRNRRSWTRRWNCLRPSSRTTMPKELPSRRTRTTTGLLVF